MISAWIYAGLCGWAIHLAYLLPAAQRDDDLVFYLRVKLLVAFVLGCALSWFGIRWALVSDMLDSRNPKKPAIRF